VQSEGGTARTASPCLQLELTSSANICVSLGYQMRPQMRQAPVTFCGSHAGLSHVDIRG
jgi:hypothetical protein